MKLGKMVMALAVMAGPMTLTTLAQASPSSWDGDVVNVQILDPNPQTVTFNQNIDFGKNFEVQLKPYTLYPDLDILINAGGTIALYQLSFDLVLDHSTILKVSTLTDRNISKAVLSFFSQRLDKPPIWGQFCSA